MDLITHNSNNGDFISKDNKVFWEVNFKDALLNCPGKNNKRVWKYFCHKTSCVPNFKSENKVNNTPSLDDYDYCDDVKDWKVRLTQNNNSSSWKIPGCEEFYKQDMFQNPFAFVEEERDEEEEEEGFKKETKKINNQTKTKSNKKSNIVSSKNINKNKNKDYSSAKVNPKSIANKANNNNTAKIMN